MTVLTGTEEIWHQAEIIKLLARLKGELGQD